MEFRRVFVYPVILRILGFFSSLSRKIMKNTSSLVTLIAPPICHGVVVRNFPIEQFEYWVSVSWLTFKPQAGLRENVDLFWPQKNGSYAYPRIDMKHSRKQHDSKSN